jgi:cytoplasmic iron level regulating protein YaaA (DUF328/UPF0246 family)
MKTIVLISCVKKKRDYRCKAEDLYISSYFKKNLAYAKSLYPDNIFILSAKYGLLPLNKEIDTYDLTLNKFPKEALIKWSADTIQQLKIETDLEKDNFIFLAGNKYRKYLLPRLKHYEIPLKGLGIGKQLQFLKNKLQ